MEHKSTISHYVHKNNALYPCLVKSDDFSRQKIIWGEISDKPKFALDETGNYFVEATTFMMTGENLNYLLLFLNSSLSEYYFSTFGTTTGVGTLRWKNSNLNNLKFHLLTISVMCIFQV